MSIESSEVPAGAQVVINNRHPNKELTTEAVARVRNGLSTWHKVQTENPKQPRFLDSATNPKFIAQVAPAADAAADVELTHRVERVLNRDDLKISIADRGFAEIDLAPILAAHINPLTEEGILISEWREGHSVTGDDPDVVRVNEVIADIVPIFDRWGIKANLSTDNFLINTDSVTGKKKLSIISSGSSADTPYIPKPAVIPVVEQAPKKRQAKARSTTRTVGAPPTERPKPPTPPLGEATLAIIKAIEDGGGATTFADLQALARSIDPEFKKARLSNILARISKMRPDLVVPAGERKGRQMGPETQGIENAFLADTNQSYAHLREATGYNTDDESRRQFAVIAERLRRKGINIPSGREKSTPEENS